MLGILTLRRVGLLLACWLVAASLRGQTAVDPAEAQVRAFIDAQIVGGPLVFAGERFPAFTLEPAAAITGHVGRYKLEIFHFDRLSREVAAPAKPGPYAVIMQVTADKKRSSPRMVTIYRLAAAIDGKITFNAGNLDTLATATDIPIEVLLQQQELLLASLKDRPWSQCASDPRVADVLAGLSMAMSVDKPPRKNLDAIAVQRQWWLNVKRKVQGLTQQFPKPFLAPRAEAQLASPVVHEGKLADAGMNPDAVEKIDKVLQAWAADTDEAFAVCVVRKGVIVIHRAYGTRDGQPMTVNTKSWMASITKSMSATLMMMLVDQGLVDLDAPIETYLPELRNVHVPTALTVRHLYTHTNGLDKWPGWSDEGPAVEARVADIYPLVKVGKTWAYNGLGYTLGGKIIENVSGEALPQFYVEHLLKPLQMEHTDVLGTHADALSVPLDIARFGQLLLNRGSYGKLRFMQPETFDKMLPQKLIVTLGPMATKTFGIGLDGAPDSGQFGHGAASAATFHVDTNNELVVVMTRNKIGTNYDKYNGQFFEAVRSSMAK